MLAWRLCRSSFADLTGEGARLYGGRWNSVGQAVVYTAGNAALAILEVRIHLDLPPDLIPDDYVLATIDLLDMPVETVSVWPKDMQAFGDVWLKQQRTPILSVPSVIVPEDYNLLLNPSHPLSRQARMTKVRKFEFDPRLWLPL